MNRRGFTLVELMVVATIVGILVRIAMPNFVELKRRAQAAKIVGDFEAVRVAAFNYNADTGTWPAERGTGQVPPQLVNYLPRGFSFSKPNYRLDWEYWVLAGGGARYPARGILIGVSVVTTDKRLGQAVVKLLGSGSAAKFSTGNSYTFILQSVGGVF